MRVLYFEFLQHVVFKFLEGIYMYIYVYQLTVYICQLYVVTSTFESLHRLSRQHFRHHHVRSSCPLVHACSPGTYGCNATDHSIIPYIVPSSRYTSWLANCLVYIPAWKLKKKNIVRAGTFTGANRNRLVCKQFALKWTSHLEFGILMTQSRPRRGEKTK